MEAEISNLLDGMTYVTLGQVGRRSLAALQEMGGGKYWDGVSIRHLSAEHLQNHAALLDDIAFADGTNFAHR